MKKEDGDASTVTTVSPPRSPDGAVVWVLSGRAKGMSLRLPGDLGAVVSIGKSRDNDLVLVVLDEPSVSRRHLEIRRTEHGLEIEDLASTNGTSIGSARVRSAIVEPGTVIHAGDVELLIGVELGNVVIPPSDEPRFGDRGWKVAPHAAHLRRPRAHRDDQCQRPPHRRDRHW